MNGSNKDSNSPAGASETCRPSQNGRHPTDRLATQVKGHGEYASTETKDTNELNARLMDLDTLLVAVVPLFLNPSPSRDTLRNWLDNNGVSRWKANPRARKGGGKVYYSVAGVEKLLRNRLLPGRLAVLHKAPTVKVRNPAENGTEAA